jgi:hypothetical protein
MKIFRFLCISMSLFLISCMAKVENEDVIESVTITSHEIVRSGPSAKVILHGVCPKYTTVLKITIGASGFDVTPASISGYVPDSGVPVGECNAGILTIEYPVPNPQQARVIPFKVKAKMPDGKISLYAALRDVDYSIPPDNLPGYALTSGGAFEGSSGITIHGSAGLVAGRANEIVITGASATLRAGLQGILYDDTF